MVRNVEVVSQEQKLPKEWNYEWKIKTHFTWNISSVQIEKCNLQIQTRFQLKQAHKHKFPLQKFYVQRTLQPRQHLLEPKLQKHFVAWEITIL